jgi:DNA-binding MarR family transcriptional regulator
VAAPTPVENPCVCATLRMATRAIARLYDTALAPTGLRTSQFSILARLADEGPSPVSWLAARLAMDRTTLAREARPLIEAGLVTDSPGADRRQRILALTDRGSDAFAAARPAWRGAQARVVELYGRERAGELLGELRDLLSVTWGLSQTE